MSGLSLIMASFGRQAEPMRFVNSVARQSLKAVELVIVDQNPDDRLVPVVAQARDAGIVCIHIRQTHPDLSTARNTGLSAATSDVVAFPDDDCWYEPDVVEKVLAQMDLPNPPDAIVAKWVEVSRDTQVPYTLSCQRSRQFRERADMSSITLFFRRELLQRTGSFDPALGLHSWYGSGEETDLMLRILSPGARVLYQPDIRVHHHAHSISGLTFSDLFRSARQRARGTGGLYAKHDIPSWVILRGLLAPLLHAACPPYRSHAIATHLGQSLGRLEGFIRWKLSGAG